MGQSLGRPAARNQARSALRSGRRPMLGHSSQSATGDGPDGEQDLGELVVRTTHGGFAGREE
jgi:hypothetical protein